MQEYLITFLVQIEISSRAHFNEFISLKIVLHSHAHHEKMENRERERDGLTKAVVIAEDGSVEDGKKLENPNVRMSHLKVDFRLTLLRAKGLY